jgi:ferredoxin
MGHGQCYAYAPDVYEPDAEGFCVVRMPSIDSVDGALLEQARQGARACPESAITVNEESHV